MQSTLGLPLELQTQLPSYRPRSLPSLRSALPVLLPSLLKANSSPAAHGQTPPLRLGQLASHGSHHKTATVSTSASSPHPGLAPRSLHHTIHCVRPMITSDQQEQHRRAVG